MADLSVPDDIRIEKLRQWLESKGIDVAQVGNELTMPSPFKEREKRKSDPHYVDTKRRLSCTVVLEGTVPSLRWQCWWSKGKTGKSFGGRSAYALSVLTRVPQPEIMALLGLEFDAKVEQAETLLEKLIAIVSQPARDREAQAAYRQQNQQQVIKPHPLPGTFLSLYEGSPLTTGPEMLVSERGILPEIGQQYGLAWDYDEQAILLPWIDQQSLCRVYQWWDGKRYRFPHDAPGRMTKSHAIFGLHLWKPGRPCILCEGAFTAMSICGMALGGSTISDEQIRLIRDCNPEQVICAFDNDHGGFDGAQGLVRRLHGIKVLPIFPPETNDWNEYLQKQGFEQTMQTVAALIQRSAAMSAMHAIALQYRGKK